MERHQTAVVLGLGESGEAAAELLAGEGTSVLVLDSDDSALLDRKAANLRKIDVEVELGCKSVPEKDFEIAVLSPGIAMSTQWVKELTRRGVPLLPELELGWRRCTCPTIAITGTNGKSTMTKLCRDVLRAAGLKVELAGNYGTPICRLSASSVELDWVVLEVSSFQLETVRKFRPDIAVLLDIEPDHLDRHGDLETYRRTKARLFENMEKNDMSVIYDRLAGTMGAISGNGSGRLTFGLSDEADYRYAKGSVESRKGRKSFSTAGSYFDNEVMGSLAAGAAAVAEACSITLDHVGRAVRTFAPLQHRFQRIAVIDGVTFINDSKATNMAAMRAALRMLPGRVRLIAGGQLKEHDLARAKGLLAEKVAAIYLIGEAIDNMTECWADVADCIECRRLETAVRRAYNDAVVGDTVLLSPGCASFDQFKDFEERGREFASIVRSLSEIKGKKRE